MDGRNAERYNVFSWQHFDLFSVIFWSAVMIFSFHKTSKIASI